MVRPNLAYFRLRPLGECRACHQQIEHALHERVGDRAHLQAPLQGEAHTTSLINLELCCNTFIGMGSMDFDLRRLPDDGAP